MGLGLTLVSLAGLSVVIIYGGQTAKVINAGGRGFSNSIRAATLQDKTRNNYKPY